MKRFYTIIIFSIVFFTTNGSFAQMANVTYSVRTGFIRSYENYSVFGSGPCQETGDEEYSGWLYASDNINTTEGNSFAQCNNNGDCTYNNTGTVLINGRTNASWVINNRVDAWEDDSAPRDGFQGDNGYDDWDDCRRAQTVGIDFRISVYPSNGTWTQTPTYGSSNEHEWANQYTWKYTTGGTTITPTTTAQNSAYASGTIRSWQVAMTTGNTYRFSACGSTEDTRIIIYAADGYTIVSNTDDNGAGCAGLPASVDFIPCTTATYYVELSHTDRSAVTTAGNLQYYYTAHTTLNAPTGITATRNPVLSCDNSTTLTLTGTLANYATWRWYAGGCGSGASIGSGTSITVTPSATTTYFARAERVCANGTVTATACASITITVNAPTAVPTTASQWNVACYNGDNFNTYSGYYTHTSLDFNTATRWTNSPSDANATGGSAYVGCPIPVDNHSYNYKRTNFPCGIYNINILGHDDYTEILVNGVSRFNHNTGCCDVHNAAVKTFLTTTDVVEIKTRELTGGTSTNVTFTTGVPVTTAATSNTCAISAYQANWNAVVGATSYTLDIDDNSDFSSTLFSGNVGNVLSYPINFPPAVTYYYRVRAVGCLTSGYSNVTSILPPALSNDYIANARNMGVVTVSGATLSVSDNNIGATFESGEPAHPDYESSDETDWLYFTTNSTPPASVQINGSESDWLDLDWRLYKLNDAAYTFPRCGVNWSKLSYVTDGDGDNNPDLCTACLGGGTATSNRQVNCLEPNSTYFILINGFLNDDGGFACGSCDQDQGNYTISIAPNNVVQGPDNLCATGTDLGILNAGATITKSNFSNYCASRETSELNSSSGDETVWYKFTTGATRTNRIDVDVDASSGDGGTFCVGGVTTAGWVRIYEQTGTPCPTNFGALTQIGSNNDITGVTQDQWYFECMKPNTTYWIQVETGGLSTCDKANFNVTISNPSVVFPSNDLVCGATAVTVQTQYTYNSQTLNNQSNVNGTNCFEPNPDWGAEVGNDNDYGVWYYIGQVPGRTIVLDGNSLSGDNLDLQYALYSSTVAKGSCTTPATTPALTQRQLEYFPPLYDEDAYFNCLDPNLYYWLLVDGGGELGILNALEKGTFSLRFWFPEEGETTFCNAEDIGVVPANSSITKLNLANKCGVSSGTFGSSGLVTLPSGFSLDNAVVYKFTTPASGSIEVTANNNPYYPGQMGLLTGDEVDLQLAVFEQSGASCSTAAYFPKGNNYDVTDGFSENLIVNCLLPNTVYYLMVDGSGLNASGYYDITIADYGKTTPNDFLCNAIDITATNTAPWTNCNSNTVVQLNGQNNYCGTTNNDIPSSLGLRPSNWSEMNGPVWYKFKAPKSGKLKIEAINTVSDIVPPYDEPEISAQLAVFFLPGGYNGTCVNLSTEKERLQYVGSNHDALFHDEEYTIECLMADSIYYLLVDGSSETLCPGCTRGEFYLKLSADPRDRSAQNDLICDAIDLGTPVLPSTWTNPAAYDTKVSPASGPATYPSPTTGYPSATGLHNGARNNANSCMRVENNFCAGIAGEPAVSGGSFFSDFTPDATVWYKFTAPTTGEVRIDVFNDPDNRGDAIYSQIAVFETSDNTCTGTMVGIATAGIPNLINGNNNLTVKCLDPGKTYFIMVDGAGINVNGYFELQVQAVPATLTGPANDDICNATSVTYPASIGTTTTVNNQTNRCATIQTIYSEPTTFTKDADVWYKFTTPNTAAPHAVEVTVTSGLPWPFGDAMDPQIALYKMNPTTGPCATSFTLVDDDYSALGLPFIETFEFHCLEQNTTYYLMVDGSGLNEQGNFRLDVKRITPHPLAGNDNICSVTTVGTGLLGTLGATTGNKVGNTTTNWHNFCSSVEVGEPALMSDGNYTLDQTVWFKFRTPNTVNNIDVEIRALNDPNNVGDQIDLQMLLVQGTSCSPFTGLTPIESVDPLLTFNATMNVCLPPNTDFYINVDGSGLNKQGYFTIEVENKGLTSAPSNDNICNAKVLPSGGAITNAYTGYLNDNNNCATLENFEKQQAAGSIQRSVWYKFTAPTSADVSIEVKGNSFVPFTTNYFLPDVTIWELSDNSYASIDNTIAGCPAPSAIQWNQLEYNDYQVIPNSLANGLYPTVVLTPLCLKPGYTYYVQVDGVAGIGLDGFFDIRIRDNQLPFTQPSNNEAAAATVVPISSASCQFSNGTWQSAGGYSFGNNPTWSNPNIIGIPTSAGIPSCTQNCGDVWYKFQMPAACGNNTKSFVKIEGDDEFNLDINGYPEMAIAAYNGGLTTSTSNLSYMKCSVGGTGVDPDFSITANPGEWIYLQIWDLTGDEQNKTFKLCVSEQKSADECVDATAMTLDVPYCWSVESHTGETPSSAVPGSGLNTCFGSGTPQHSSYFKFTTDAAVNFCDDYFIYINTAALAKLLPSGANHACLAGVNSSVSLNMALWEVKPGGTLCTPGAGNVAQEDCQTWNDCGGGSFGSNVTGPHGNGGLIQDTIWYNLATGNSLLPNTTYYIVLDYNIDNPLYADRVVLDGTITVGRRCQGRTWEYTTAPSVSTSKYCTSRDGWRHYYDDKGTVATGDDKYIFSLFPNGNTFEGNATITLDPTFHRFEDFPNHFAEYVMRRRWDFQVTSGTITNPVKVRFYYQNSEKQEIITAAQTFAVNYPSNYEDFEWFKSANGHVFSPYTDVNPKVISVGPNGYSETGCLSYWNAAGVYVGPPGVTRCITKVITDWDDNNAYHQWCNGVRFCEYNDLTGFSGGTGGTGDSPYDVSPLPVELISFTGYNEGSVNVLNWSTASEKNTLKFEVERKISGTNGFTYIGEKPAAGNSSIVLNYNLNDESPVIGDNYYRLKIIDIDGTYEYSQTILINNKETASYIDMISKIYPNPVNHILYIDYQSSANSNVKLKVFDAIGKEILVNSFKTVKGNQQFKLEVTYLANAVYTIQIQDENTGRILQTKFVKE